MTYVRIHVSVLMTPLGTLSSSSTYLHPPTNILSGCGGLDHDPHHLETLDHDHVMFTGLWMSKVTSITVLRTASLRTA